MRGTWISELTKLIFGGSLELLQNVRKSTTLFGDIAFTTIHVPHISVAFRRRPCPRYTVLLYSFVFLCNSTMDTKRQGQHHASTPRPCNTRDIAPSFDTYSLYTSLAIVKSISDTHLTHLSPRTKVLRPQGIRVARGTSCSAQSIFILFYFSIPPTSLRRCIDYFCFA